MPLGDASAAASLSAHAADTIALDAMGGDGGADVMIKGAALAARADPKLRFLLFIDPSGPQSPQDLPPELRENTQIRLCERSVGMDVKPSEALRTSRGTTIWSALDAVAQGEAGGAVSAGNTGALMGMALLRLRAAPGVTRPAIAALWPSRNPSQFNVVLDVGANLRADDANLVEFAYLGADYARRSLNIQRPRVALLNNGTEAFKGPLELRAAAEKLSSLCSTDAETDPGFEFVGFVEGDDLPSATADVIVTDGFTGNIALKSAEGAARMIGLLLRETLNSSFLNKLGALLAGGALARLKRAVDPRRLNGGVFLGLRGVVVKSHGASDPVGVASALALAARMSRSAALSPNSVPAQAGQDAHAQVARHT